MHLLYCDETNMESRSSDFFAYAGVAVDGAKAKQVSQSIDEIFRHANVPADYKLKFNPGPTGFTNQQFIDLKTAVINCAIENQVGLLVSVILHDIAKSPDEARRNAINTLCYHFDCLLNRSEGTGVVLIDRFTDKQIDAHLAEKFSVGVVGLPFTPKKRLANVIGFHYSAVGQSHFPSLIDVVLGSLRFSINAFTRNDEKSLEAARKILAGLAPMFYCEENSTRVSELSFMFSPKEVKSDSFRQKYAALHGFLKECGVHCAQSI